MVLLAVSLLSLSFPDPYLVHKAVILSEITQICAVHCLFRVRLSDFRGKQTHTSMRRYRMMQQLVTLGRHGPRAQTVCLLALFLTRTFKLYLGL